MPPIAVVLLTASLGILGAAFFIAWRARRRTTKYAFLLTAALVVTCSSLLWTRDVATDRDSLRHLSYGWPISFVDQNQSRFDPPFPTAMFFGWELSSDIPGELANRFRWARFFLSLFLNTVACVALQWIIERWVKRPLPDGPIEKRN